MLWIILLLGILATGLIGLPVGIGLGLTGLFILEFVVGGATSLAATAVWNQFNDFILSSIPLFILMGEILLVSGISQQMYRSVAPLFRRLPGGLLHTNIVVCTLFGAVAGTSTATAAAIGSVAYPELKKRGYDRATIVGTLAAGGTQGLLIPPSVALLIYGATQGVSIGQLFMAGIVPALIMMLAFMLVVYITALVRPSVCPVDNTRVPVGQILIGLFKIWPVAILIFAVLGTIYLGMATPTEAAGLGVVAAIFIGFLFGDLTPRKMLVAAKDSVVIFATLGVLLIGALILAQAISITGVPSQISTMIGDLNISPYMTFALVVLLYLVLGCFFDGAALMLMTLPVVFPVLTGMGFDPVWLGVMITLLIEIGLLTPPVGLNLFVLVALTRNEVNLAQAVYASIPYWLIMLCAIALFTYFPQLVLALPQMMMR